MLTHATHSTSPCAHLPLPLPCAAAIAAHDAEEAPQYERLKATLEQAPSLRTHLAAALDAVAAAMNATKASYAAGGASFTAPVVAAGAVPLSVPAGANEL